MEGPEERHVGFIVGDDGGGGDLTLSDGGGGGGVGGGEGVVGEEGEREEEGEEDEEGDYQRPSRLHRRDTPHHLKNKRISTANKEADLVKVASIIAQVRIPWATLGQGRLS